MVREIVTYECEKCGREFENKLEAEEHENKPTFSKILEPIPGVYKTMETKNLENTFLEGVVIAIKGEDKFSIFDEKLEQHVRSYRVLFFDHYGNPILPSPNHALATEIQELSQEEFDNFCKNETTKSISQYHKFELVRGRIVEE